MDEILSVGFGITDVVVLAIWAVILISVVTSQPVAPMLGFLGGLGICLIFNKYGGGCEQEN